MNNFDTEFKQTTKMFWVIFIFNALLSLAVIGGIGYVIFESLKHFGIL
ncbi:hypothetical protein [Metabacillus halosaccharovorans]|nr:hypothetical protein [Metabacillus halosaccharovorans]